MSSNLQMKILAKETAIYGVSSIVGKFLNWMLVPLYTYVLQQQSDYGIVTNLYAWTALLLVILTYGMETGFFRFANKEGENAQTVYSTSLITLFTTSLLFAIVCVVWQTPIADALGYPAHSEFIALLSIVVSMDAFASIPFAYLRYKKRPLQFAALKLLFVFLNIALNLFFLVLCPKIQDWNVISSWYNPNYGVGYVFVANIIATAIQTLCLLPYIVIKGFSWTLLRQMLKYSLPLLVLGVCGIMNQTLDRILFPFFYTGADAQTQLGIYGACFKVAMVMMMFTQAFRYAYEPFVFAKHKDKESVEAYADAMKYYGCDKPDTRFEMKFVELMDIMKGHGFPVFDSAEYVGGICAKGAATYTRKQLDALTDFVRRPQIGAKGMVYARVEADGTVKSSVDKFYTQEVLQAMKAAFNAEPGDLILILSGDDTMKTRKQLCELRLEVANQLGLRDKNKFSCLWVVDFPLFEYSEEEGRYMAMHHPFTSPKPEDIPLLDTDMGAVRANAYDMIINGVEVGGGSIRIYDSEPQNKMFELLGFTPERAQQQFGWLLDAFKYGAPPHGGLAYGLDRWVSLFAGLDSIRDCIAFPKNNAGRDVMMGSPSRLDQAQLDELQIKLDLKE